MFTPRLLQVSPDGLLLQSSTVADVVQYRFAGGKVVPIARAYVEFVERKLLPQDQVCGRGTGMHTPGVQSIAGAYVEFVERKLLPQDRQVGVSGGMHTVRCVERTEVAVATRQGHN